LARQLVGKWETLVACRIESGKPPMKSKGTESVWSIAESNQRPVVPETELAPLDLSYLG
jgi:hypothetical protein